MISITDEQQALLLSNDVVKNWSFRVYNNDKLIDTIPINKMVDDSFSITEPLCSAQSLTYGSCESATMTARIANVQYKLKGKKIVVNLSASDKNTSVDLDMGVYYVDEATRENGTWFHKITAYDGMSRFDVNVADWYNSLDFPMTLLQFRTSLCDYVGIQQQNISLPCDALQIAQTISPSTLQGREVLQAICRLNACFGHFTRDGKLTYMFLGSSPVIHFSNAGVNHYKDGATHEAWNVPAYDSVTVRSSDDDVGITIPDEYNANTLIISDNFLTYDLNTPQLEMIANAIYDKIKGVSYTVHSMSIQGRPWLEVGDMITITSDEEDINTFILERTLSGFQSLTDTLSAKGSEDTQTEYNTQAQIEKLKQLENKLSRTVEETVSTITDLEKGFTEIKQTAGQVSVKVSKDSGTLTTIINGDSWEAQYTDENGETISGLSFDFENKQFLFNGAGKFTGAINVNDKFVVSENGDVSASGNVEIYGGRYYANEDGGGFTTMDASGFGMYNSGAVQRIKLGFAAGNSDYPYLLLNSGDSNTDVSGMVKKFLDGMWVGNSTPANETGNFKAKSGYNGIFVAFDEGKTYVVSGTNMKSIYVGEAIAKFG